MLLRQKSFPIQHVVAEIAAFPLASEVALNLAVSVLGDGGADHRLWRSAESGVLATFSGFSVEEAISLRDAIWYANGSPGRIPAVPLEGYVRQLARQYLSLDGSMVRPRAFGLDPCGRPLHLGDEDVYARQWWRWIRFALPPDLLIAGVIPSDVRLPVSVPKVAMVTAPLRRMLEDEGFAEIHQHLGASFEFSDLWLAILQGLGDLTIEVQQFQSPGACMDDGDSLGGWLVRAAICRALIVRFLSQMRSELGFEDFTIQFSRHSAMPEFAGRTLRSTVSDVSRGTIDSASVDFRRCQALYRRLVTTASARFKTLSELRQADLAVRFGLGRPENPEIGLLVAAFNRLSGGVRDPVFSSVFWQYVRVRNLFYRHIVQRPMTPGLLWFVRHYGRLKPCKSRVTTELTLDSACEVTGGDSGLLSLEVRTSPDESSNEMRRFLRMSSRAMQPRLQQTDGVDEFGFVLHFTKSRGGGIHNGTPAPFGFGTTADPRTRRNHGVRYANYFRQIKRQAAGWMKLLERHPESLAWIRGVDVASDETAVPSWVLRPVFIAVQDASSVASRRLKDQRILNVPTIGTTCHAGEDFVHLLTGLRNVEESVRMFRLREGDRLGHAIALGVDCSTWCSRFRRVMMPKETRFWDLCWLLFRVGRDLACVPVDGIHRAEGELQDIAADLFREDRRSGRIDLRMLDGLYMSLADDQQLRSAGFPTGPHLVRGGNSAQHLLHRYLTDPLVFRRGQEPTWVDVNEQHSIFEAIQSTLREDLARRSIAVEINPSSNLLIGDVSDLRQHPMWRMRPPIEGQCQPVLSIAIGSDDPVTFATSLPEEYQFVYDSLILAGVPQPNAMRWLNTVRKTSLTNRFTISPNVVRDLESRLARGH